LNVAHKQIGLDDEISGNLAYFSVQRVEESFANEHLKLGTNIVASSDVHNAIQYIRKGSPAPLRPALWSLILQVQLNEEVPLLTSEYESTIVHQIFQLSSKGDD
jgi:hypothetical protein